MSLAQLSRMIHRPHATRTAFTALEVMFALSILAVALLVLMAALTSGDALNQQTREVELAMQVANQRLELLRGTAPTAVVSQIGAGLTITTDVGEPTLKSPTLVLEILSEAETQTVMGLGAGTLDLDLDGNAGEDSTGSVKTDYRIAPVRATVQWTSAGGVTSTRTIFTIFYPQSTVSE